MMNFMSIPSLKHIAFVSAAAFLWNERDIRTLVTDFVNSELFTKLDKNLKLGKYIRTERKENWLKIEKEVIQKVPQLSIPVILEEEILGYIQSVGLQILLWMEYHCRYCSFNLDLPNQFFWTPQGTVDKKKTAEELIKDESIDIITRYKLACINCLESDIMYLWNRMPKNIQTSLRIDENIGDGMLNDLLIFWRMYLNKEMAKLGKMIRKKTNLKSSAYKYMFRCAADSGNKSATEYFLQKLLPREKCLVETALYVVKIRRECLPRITDPPKEYYSEVFCFLLSHMKDEQQVKVFKKDPTRVLSCLLDWPWQNFFVNAANRMWNFLDEQENRIVLWSILDKTICLCTDYDYKKMFKEYWLQTPHSHKRFVVRDSFAGLIALLFECNDKGNLILVIQDEAFEEKDQFIFNSKCLNVCEDVFQRQDLFKFFLQHFISSKNELIRFKERYEEYIETRRINNEIERGLVERSLRFIGLRRNRVQEEILERGEGQERVDVEGEVEDEREVEAMDEIFIPHLDENGAYVINIPIHVYDHLKRKQVEFLKFLNDFIRDYDKRMSIDQDSSGAAKRLCSIDLRDSI